MKKIVVLGSTNTDMVITGKRLPVPGETISDGHVIITMGSKGVYCGECGKLFPCRKVKAVDCVAAGDTFNGAFAVALAEGRPVADAIAFAQKAAAISVTRPGAQSSVPYRHEIHAPSPRLRWAS